MFYYPKTEAEHAWLIERSRAMHAEVDVPGISRTDEDAISDRHMHRAVADFKTSFDIDVEPSQMYWWLLIAAPDEDDPTFMQRCWKNALQYTRDNPPKRREP
jgi:hypothetical protein